jgi:hypothetical protein
MHALSVIANRLWVAKPFASPESRPCAVARRSIKDRAIGFTKILLEDHSDAKLDGKARNRIWSYWPEIDGLRSIAVLSVIMFHFDRQLLSGGFVGVDIFFVISGFLITSILLNDIDQRQFSITRFYQRRIARIAPAFFVVLGTTLGVTGLIYSAQDFASAGANSLAAALSVINIY